MFMITLEASYAHCMKMIASLTSLNVFGMEMMGKLEVILFFVEEFFVQNFNSCNGVLILNSFNYQLKNFLLN